MYQPPVSAKTTHDLWVEARTFNITIARPTPTTIELTIKRPTVSSTVNGAVVTFSTKPISNANHPEDGTQYVASADFGAPADLIGGAQVVGFYSNILAQPWPAGLEEPSVNTSTVTITIINTLPTQIYYASVHAATNTLQYYPIGVQSYALEASEHTRGTSSYTGNIPSLPEAPLQPTVGTVYFDQQLNLVQYWTGAAWIPSRSDAILTGSTYPGVLGQTYLLGGSRLMTFNEIKWVQNDSSNTQFRVGTSWVPMQGVQSAIQAPADASIGDFYWDYTQNRGYYWDGSSWIIPSNTNSLFSTGSTLVQAFIVPIELEPMELPAPYIGQLFYNTTSKTLDAWTGSMWKQANTDQAGIASPEKISVGSDGSYDERIEMINILKGQLGWPMVCVELKEEQFEIALNNALDNYRLWSSGAYRLQYIIFPLIPQQQTYYLNSAADKTNKIVDVQKVHRISMNGINNINGPDAIWSSNILGAYYGAGTLDTLSYHLAASHSEDLRRLFAGDMTFLWDEPSRELTLLRKVYNSEKVILECMMERTEQELMVDRWARQFIQNWALAEAKMQLGMIRSKFSSGTPGAAGTISLNGELLVSEARQDMTELKEEILNYEYGGHIGHGNVSFLIG